MAWSGSATAPRGGAPDMLARIRRNTHYDGRTAMVQQSQKGCSSLSILAPSETPSISCGQTSHKEREPRREVV
jgi:hypothetical protein